MKNKLLKLLCTSAVVIFTMAAGAACYHQTAVATSQREMQQWQQEESSRQQAQEIYEMSQLLAREYKRTSQLRQDYRQAQRRIRELEAGQKSVATSQQIYDSLDLLALCVEAEAGNQSIDGKRMVADVILNRVDDPAWPDTVEGVITQRGQFSAYWNGAMDRIEQPSEETVQAVEMELEERGWPGLYYFREGRFSDYGTPWKQVGDHYFSTK